MAYNDMGLSNCKRSQMISFTKVILELVKVEQNGLGW